MQNFDWEELTNANIYQELDKIGFDKTYIQHACEKFEYKNIKIYDLTIPQANILKQTALSVGADCATHRETITAKIPKTDCILGGSISQYKKIGQKLLHQPFGLKNLGNILNNIKAKTVVVPVQTQLVGILNITKDSFSDGGQFYGYDDAVKHLDELVNDGANIIDIGAESTRPSFTPISENEQLEKIIPIVEYAQKISIPISIDTRSAKVAEESLKRGAKIINDVSGLKHDKNMASIIAKYDAKIVIQDFENGNYTDICNNLKTQIEYAQKQGIKSENIIIDIGIGFGKTKEENFALIQQIDKFKSLGYPIMVGISRKSFLGLNDEDNFTKDIYTLALNSLLINKKVDFLRVHNIKLHKKLLNILNQLTF